MYNKFQLGFKGFKVGSKLIKLDPTLNHFITNREISTSFRFKVRSIFLFDSTQNPTLTHFCQAVRP